MVKHPCNAGPTVAAELATFMEDQEAVVGDGAITIATQCTVSLLPRL